MLKIGTTVRSFDFDEHRNLTGRWASFIEGKVLGFEEHEGCMRVRILVSRDVKRGKERDNRVGREVFPPVNGTETWTGDKTSYIEILQNN